MDNKAKVVVHLPSDAQYEYSMVRSLDHAIELHESEGVVRRLYMAFKNIVGARNQAVADMLADKAATHLMFIDSDQVLPELTLARLLQHNVDIVGGLYCRKLHPPTPLAFVKQDNGFRWIQPERKLTEIDAIATGCLLIKRSVFEQMSQPWFLYESAKQYGEMEAWKTTTEDITFCNNARKLGIKVHVDGSLWIGHIAQAVIWPDTGNKARVELYGQGGAF